MAQQAMFQWQQWMPMQMEQQYKQMSIQTKEWTAEVVGHKQMVEGETVEGKVVEHKVIDDNHEEGEIWLEIIILQKRKKS